MILTRPISEISLEDVLTEGAGRSPEEIADAVQRWRSLTQEAAADQYFAQDADKWTQGTVKLNSKVGEVLAGLRVQAVVRNLAAMYPSEADQAWAAYRDAGYSAKDVDSLGRYGQGLSIMEQEMDHPRWRVASPAATLRAGIPIKAGDDVSLADGSMVEAPILATYQLHRTGGGEEAFLRITDPETGLPRESGGYRIPVPEFDQQTLATMAQQAVTASQAAAARAQQLQAAGEELPVGSAAASYGVHSAQKAALAEAQLQAARAQQLSGPQALAFAQHEAVIERAKSQEAIKTKIGDESAWSRLTDSRGGFITGLATALGPVGRFLGKVRGMVDEDAAEGVRMAEANVQAGRAPFEGMPTAMQRLEPGNTRRQFEGGWWNETVVASQESVGQMIPALLIGGGLARAGGLSAGTRAFEAVAVSPLAVSAAGQKYNAILEEAQSIAAADPDRAARMRQNALTDAVMTGIIEGGTEMLIPTIGESVSRGMRGFVRRLPSTMGKEALEEVPAQVGENLTDNYLLDAQKTLLEGVPTAMASAGMAAAGMSGGAALVGSFSRRSQVSATPPGGAWPSANPQPVRVDTGLTADALGAEGSSPSRGADPIPTSGELPALTPPTSTDPAGTAPESVESLRAQRRRVASGDKPAMLFPGVAAADVAAEFQPTEDDLLVMTDTPAGAVLHPLDIPAQTVRQAAAEDRIGDVLGYGVPSKPKSGTPVTVVQRDQRGEELAAVAVPAAEIGQAASALAAQTQPGDTVTVETPQQTLATRMAAMRPALDATVPAAEGDVIKDFNLSRRQPEPDVDTPPRTADIATATTQDVATGQAGRPPEIQGAGERAAAAGQTATPAMATPPPVASQVPRKKGKNWKPFIGGGRWSLPKNRGSFDVIDALFTIGTRINRLPKNISKTDPLRKTAEYDALLKFQKQALLLYSHTTLPLSDGSGSSIDAAADAIYRTYPSLLTEPTATALVDALIGAFNERRKIRDRMRQGGNWRLNQEAMEAGYSPSQYREMMAQVKEWERQGKRQDAAFKKANKPDHDDIQVQAGELDIGETILINGTELTVREILPNGDIVLEDGDRFGTQTVTPGFDLFLDKREEEPDEWNAVFEPGAVLRYAQSHGADTNLPASLDIAATLATLAEDPGYQQDYLPGIGGQEQSLLPLRTSPAAPAPAAPAAVSPGARKPGRKPERPGRRIDEGQRYGQFAAGLKADFSRGPRITSVLADMVDGSIPAWSPIGAVVNTPADFALLCQSVRTPLFESVKVAVVNQKNEIMHAQILTVGSVNQTILDPRDVLRAIQTARAMKGRGRVEGVIISHNHPSGRVEPSDADRAMTTKVKDLLAKAGGVPLLDHIITNGQEFYSFRTYGKGQISQTNQPAWEVHPAAQRITVDTRDQFDLVIRLLRQDAGQEHGHVIYLDTRWGVIAVERTALATADDIMEHMQQTASMLGASSVALDVPHLLTSEVQRLLAASLTLGNAAAARLVDMSTLSVPSYNASGLMREEDPSYSAPGFLREEDPSYSATHPVGPEWRQNIFGQKVAVDPRIRQSWRQTFSPQFYATFTEAGLAKTVKGWIAENGGIEGATALFMDDASGLRDYEVNALGQQLALAWEQRAARQERRGENPSDAEQTLDAIIVRLERQATQAGQALRAFGMWAKFSPRGIIRKIQRQAAEAREADVLESVGKSAEQLVAAVNATDLTQRTDEENEILRLWNLMMADGPTDRGLAIARTLKLLLPQRVDYRQRIDARHVQAAFRQRMTARGGDGLVRKFWQLMAGPQPGPGALAFFDAATQETLTDLLNRAVKNAGLDSQHSQTNQPTDVEKLAAQLSADPLRWEKVQAAVIAMEAEIDALPETRTVIRQVNGQEQSVLVTREMIRAAWEEATADMDVVLGGPSMLRRMIRSELASRKITQQTWAGLFAKGQPPDAAAASLRQQTVNAILAQVRGKMTSGTDTLTLGDELGAAFDEVAKERFAAWMVDRENRHRAAKQAERRKAFMAALRPKMQTQAATDKLDAIFAAAVVGGPQTAGTPTEDNPLLALLRKHLHTDVPDFLRIAEQLGVPRDVAAEYDAAVQWHRQRAAERAVRLEQDRLIAQLEPRSKKARDAMPRLLRILLEARSNGAIRRPEFLEAYAAVMGLPRFTPELSATIRHLAARVQAAPAGSWIRQSAVADLMAALARWEGVKTSEVMTAFWYANILSGIGTHLVNVSSTAAHLAMRIATTLASAHPRHWINFARGLVAGAAKGTRNAAAAFWHGEPVMKGEELFTKQDVLEVLWSSQPNTVAQTILKYGAASWGRYVFRALSAADAFFYHTAAEGRAWLDASRRSGGQAKAILGLDASSIASAREQALLDLEQAQIPATAAHIDRRTMEIMESRRSAEISGAARHFGGQVTFNYSPQGTLGAIAEGLNHVIRQVPIIRAAVPFTRIVANLGEMSLDWTGYGMVRGALGMHTSTAMRQMVGGKIDPKQRFGVRERIERSLAGAIGVAGAAAIYALARSKKDDDDAAVTFMLYGGGPADATRRSQMPKSWRPYTLKIGDHYISYAETPLTLILSAFGTALDQERFGSKLNRGEGGARALALMGGMGKSFSRTGVLSSLDQLFGIMDGKGSPTGLLGRTVSGFIPGQSFLRDLAKALDPDKVDTATFAGILMQNMPVLRSSAGKVYNCFGDVVREPGPWIISRIVTRADTSDAEAIFLTTHGLHISDMDQEIVLGAYLTPRDLETARRLNPTDATRAAMIDQLRKGYLTDEQRQRILLSTGPKIRRAVAALAAENSRTPIPVETLRSRLTTVVRVLRRDAMADLIGIKIQSAAPMVRRLTQQP